MADDDKGPRFVGDPEPEPPPAATPQAAKKAAGPKFRRDEAAAASKRTTAILVVMLLLAVLAGILFALPAFLSPPPKPRLLTVHVERYDSPGWGVAAWARADADKLVEAFRQPDGGRTADADRNLLQSDKLRDRLDALRQELADPKAAERPLVLSVSALAAVRDGAPCVLPNDADPFDPARWVPLDDVLKALATDPPVRRLLLLDLHRPTADPFLGRPTEDAAAAVHALFQQRQDAGTLPCAVIAAAGPGEVSLPAATARCSAFGLYLSDGLLGGAAGDGGNRDEVTVGGLARFVAHRVTRYARRVHDRPQTPRLYAPKDGWDFVLATGVSRQALTPPTEPANPDGSPKPPRTVKPEEYAYPADLRKQWKRWDALLAGGADQQAPEAFARLTAALLRAERLWLGTEDTKYAGDMCDQAFNFWVEGQRALRPGGPKADNGADPRARVGKFRLAARDVPPAPPELAAALNKYLSARTAADAKPEGWKAERQGFADKATDPAAAARLVWRKLCDEQEPTRDKVQALAELLTELTAGDKPPPLERLLVRFLAERRFQTEQGPPFPADAVTAWLRAEDRLGQALAAGPAGFGPGRRFLDEAEAARRDAAQRLFLAGSTEQVKPATERFQAAADGFARAATAGGAAPKLAAAVPPLLRAVLAYQPIAAAAGGEVFDRWKEAAELLDELLGAGKRVDEAGPATKRLTDVVTPARVEELEKRPTPWGKPDDVRAAAALVAGPVLPADPRAKVWELVRREGWHLHEEARKLDAADLDNGFVPPALGPPVPADPAPADARRAESAGTLLRLAVGGEPGGPPARVWREDVPKRAARAVEAKDWAAAARLVRVVPPAVAAVPRPEVSADRLGEPTAADRAAYRDWFAAQLRDGYQTRIGDLPLIDRLDKDKAFRRALAAD